MAITSNTANTTVTDRTASGNQPDNTPATGTTTSGSGGSGVSSVSSGSSNVTVTSTGGGGTGAVTISVSGGSGTGNVTGTGTTTVGHVAVFNNTSATGIQDGGPASLTIAGNAVSLGGSVSQDSITGLAPTTAGIVKHTSTANTLGIAVAADFPTLNQNTTGNAATVTGLSVTSGKTLTANNTLTLSGTDGSTLNIGTGGTLGSAAYTASSAYVAASSGTATNLTLAGTLKDSNSSSAGTSGQVLSSLGTGTKWVTPSSGGNVTGTSPTVSGNVAVFNNTTGTGIQDGGTLGTAAFTASTAYVSATTTQTAHKFLAGPLSGTAAPTFRVIDPTDVPTLNQSTTGNAATATTATTATTAGNVTGIVAVANGGTGTSGPSLINGTGISVTGSWPNQTITNTTSGVPSGGTQGQVLLQGASTAGWYNTSINVTAYSSLSAAQTAAGTNGTLYFPRAYTIPSSVSTITQNVIVEGLLTLSAACLFSGTIKAPLMQIFSGGTVTIGQATPEIYPEWFGAHGSVDDSTAISNALSAVTLTTTTSTTFANQYVMLTGNYTLNSTITITGGRMFKVNGGAQFTAGTATDGIVYSGNGSNVQGDIPAMVGFTGTALYLAGTNLMNLKMFGCFKCGIGLKMAAVSNRDSLDNKVEIMFLQDTTTGVYFTGDGSIDGGGGVVAMQGNEIYVNFYTLDDQPSSTAYAAYWDNVNLKTLNGNTLEFKAIEFNGKTNTNGFYNASTNSGGTYVEGWNIKCDDWFGGINNSNSSSAKFLYGYFQACTFQFSMQGSLDTLPWSVFQLKGDNNRVVFTNGGGNYNINTGGQPVSRFTCPTSPNSRSSFNTGGTSFPPFNNRLTCQYNIASGSSIAPSGTLTLYAYSPVVDGYTQPSGVIAASNNFSAVSFTQFGLILESAVDNNTVNANEIILTFRNVSANTLSSGYFNFILTVGL